MTESWDDSDRSLAVTEKTLKGTKPRKVVRSRGQQLRYVGQVNEHRPLMQDSVGESKSVKGWLAFLTNSNAPVTA